MNRLNLITKLVPITFNRGIVAFIGLTILLATSQALQHATAQNVSSESATVDTTHSVSMEEEARRFMASYANDLLSHDPDAIAARYSRRGTYVVFPGDWNMQPHDSIANTYREEWQGPEAFEWHDLSYEVLGDDAVAVIGGFRFETDENSGALGTYTALLVREDGELRIRLENESFDNLPPEECKTQEEPCDLPLEHAAMEQYIGEYKVAGQEDSARVYSKDGSMMIHSPGFPPMQLLYRGNDEFRMAEFPGIRLLFDGAGKRAMSYIMLNGMVLGSGKRATVTNGKLGLSRAALRAVPEGDQADEACVEDLGRPGCLVAIVRTSTLQWEGEQTYIPLYADGTASGLVVVNFNGGLLYGTAIPDSWTWLDEDTVEICTSVNILRNEVDFPPMERDCAPHPITGKELDLDGDGNVDLVETFTIIHPLFHRERPRD